MSNYPAFSEILKDDSAVERGLNLTREKNDELVKEKAWFFQITVNNKYCIAVFFITSSAFKLQFLYVFSNSLAPWGTGKDLHLFQEIPFPGLGVPTETFRSFILNLRTNIGIVPRFAHDHFYPDAFLPENLNIVDVIVICYGLDGLWILFRCGQDFPHLSRPAVEPIQPPDQWLLFLFPGGNAVGD